MEYIMIDTSGFTGTSCYHRFSVITKLVLTDGTKYLADKYGAYWLMDLIASWQYKSKVRRESFQVWTLEKRADGSARILATDGNHNKLTVQIVPWTDFPESIKLYCVDGVILLPSEY
jgi:hypothetical protein